MIQVEPLRATHLPDVQALVNAHLNAVIAGYTLPIPFITSRLERNPEQPTLDPWVTERTTLCALESGRVTAVAHLLKYGAGSEVSSDYQGASDIAWFLAWPSASEAATAVLNAAHEIMVTWNARRVFCWDTGLPAQVYAGLPDVWPHIAATIQAAGYRPAPGLEDAVYGGPLTLSRTAQESPVAGVTLKRKVGARGTRFSAVVNGSEVGYGECKEDLTLGGALPALRGWGELVELWVDTEWRNQGLGTWLVSHVVHWLLLAKCDRIVLNVAADDEAAGAGRFYNRWGWTPLARQTKGWHLPLERLPRNK